MSSLKPLLLRMNKRKMEKVVGRSHLSREMGTRRASEVPRVQWILQRIMSRSLLAAKECRK
jgi:hypothetical protein